MVPNTEAGRLPTPGRARLAVALVVALAAAAPASTQEAPAAPSPSPEAVRLINASFEQPDPVREGQPLGWGVYPGSHDDARLRFVWDDQQAHSGRRSVSIVVGSVNASWLPLDTAAYANTLDSKDLGQQRPAAVVGHEYLLSAWVRAEGSGRQRAALVLRWTDGKAWVPSYVREHFVLDGEGWQLVGVSAVAPENARYIVPLVQVGGSPEPGRVWFDDVAVVDRTGLSCRMVEGPVLAGLPSGWHCSLELGNTRPAPVPFVISLRSDQPEAKPQETRVTVPSGGEAAVDFAYQAAWPHRVRCLVTSADDPPMPYFLDEAPVLSPLEAAYLSPRYRATIFGPSAGRVLRLRTLVRAREALRDGLKLKAEVLAAGQAVAENTVEKPSPEGVIELTLPELAAGDHQVRLALLAGGETVTSATLPLRARPDLKPAAAIGDHNELLVDGQPTFPVGFYSTLSEDFARFAAEGFNTVLTYTTDVGACARMTERAGEAGLRLIVSALRPYVADRDAQGLAGAVSQLAGLPGLLGYYLWDEPSLAKPGQSPDDMRWVYEQALDCDPSHLTCTVFCVPSEFRAYADTTDVFLVDPYVCFKDSQPDMTQVADWVDQARRAVGDSKPVWIVPQCFAHPLGPGSYRMPTIEEQRCMTYLALVHGAKGILWFVYTGFCIHSDEVARKTGLPSGQAAWVFRGTIPACYPLRWDGITRIAREVKELAPLLLAPDPEQTQSVTEGGDAVHCVLKGQGAERLLLAVNTRNRQAAFRCLLPGVRGAPDVLWEDRKASLEDGVLEDIFQPYEVHAYSFRVD